MKVSWSWMMLFFILVSCKHYNLPRGFPDVDKMAKILVEIQIAEGTISQFPSQSAIDKDEAPGYYKYILDQHGYTTMEFDSVRKWYAHHPELYLKVYDKMLINLSKEEARVRSKSDKEKELEKEETTRLAKERRLKNFWRDSTFITVLPTDTFDKRLPYTIDVDTFELKGTLHLSASYKFMKEDVSDQPKIVLSAFYDETLSDSVFQSIPHSFNERGASVILVLRDSIFPRKIEGYLLYQDSSIQSDVQIRNIYLENKIDSLKMTDEKKKSDFLKYK